MVSNIPEYFRPHILPSLLSSCQSVSETLGSIGSPQALADIHSIIGRTISVLLGPEPGRLGT